MDTSDRHDSTLPARSPSFTPQVPSRVAAPIGMGSRELAPAAAPTMQVDPVSILRGLLRNWWKILGLWLLVSAPLVYGVYTQVKPTYLAYSRLRIEPTQQNLFENMGAGHPSDRAIAIETEINHIRTDQVLATVVGDPAVVNLKFVKNSISPMTDLQSKLSVVNTKNTNFVVVSLESTDPEEAATIVKSVVDTYLESYNMLQTSTDEVLKRNIQKYLDTMRQQREDKQKQLAELIDRGVDNKDVIPRVVSKDGTASEPAATTTHDLSLEQLRNIKNQLLEIDVELITARSRLESRTADFQDAGQGEEAADTVAMLPEDEIQRRVVAEFYSDPMIADLHAKKKEIERRLAHVEQGARKKSDPSRIAHDAHLGEINDELAGYWASRSPEIRQRILAAGGEPVTPGAASGEPRQKTIKELREEVAELERKQSSFLKLLADAEVESKQSNSDTFRAQFLRTEIDGMAADEKLVSRRLQDLTFRTNRELVRVSLIDPAKVPKQPSDSKRMKLMAALPVGILAVILGLFALLEVKAERVGNPDALSSRVQSEVYSLPPIPIARSPRRLGSPGDDDHIDRFIQRLDHLRFAVCGDHPDVGLGRCVLISSAVGGEGKTTLAAQLAARCGHSGHATLLIDADLRRGSLCPLLDVPEGPGLSDVLTKEGLNVEDLVIPVQGGTFHLLSAGTPSSDTSRVFQGRAFGMLIARLRQLYDLIIIDSPPILPVPDALIMGRWTDGVVLASRYDVSRAPQVERARRQLDLAGIPVLGTVINGMRTSDSYYGRYTYSRQPSDRERPADATSAG